MSLDTINEKLNYRQGLVLRQARDAVSKPGAWIQGTTGDCFDGPKCLMGHVIYACWSNENSTGPNGLNTVRELIRQHLGETPVVWNDEAGRTQEEVVAMFDELIELYFDPQAWRKTK